MKIILAIIGIISLFIGFIGIFLPLLPTIPFVLLSAYLFAKSSTRMHNWIMNHKLFGEHIRSYNEDKSIPFQAKIMAISMIWSSMLFSVFYVVNEKPWLQLLFPIIAIAVTIFLLSLKTRKVVK